MTTLYESVINYINSLPKKLKDEKRAENIREFILKLDAKDNTKSGIITKVKKYILDNKLFVNNDNLVILNAKELYDKIIKESYEKRKVRPVIDVDISDIDKIFNLKNDKKMTYKGVYEINVYSLYSYLLATSGMRTNELWDNSFEVVNRNTIKPSRLSKLIADTTPTDAVVVLLIPAKDWIKLFNILQELIKSKDIKYGSTVFSGIKRKLESINPNLTGHSLRKIYLAYHRQVLKTDADKLPSVSTARLLNHRNENASTYYAGAVTISGDTSKDIITDYSKLKVVELKDILKNKGIKYKSKAKKAELISLIN
jgi:integrase